MKKIVLQIKLKQDKKKKDKNKRNDDNNSLTELQNAIGVTQKEVNKAHQWKTLQQYCRKIFNALVGVKQSVLVNGDHILQKYL